MHREIIPARFFRSSAKPFPSPRTFAGWAAAVCLLAAGFSSCAAPQAKAPDVAVILIVDNERRDLQIAPGTTVANVLAQAGVLLGPLDRVIPPLYSLIADGSTVRVIRVAETFEVERVAIPFQRQIVRNEALPPDETRLIQAGAEGLQEITYRIITEDGIETSRTPLRTTLIKEAVPEILMIGAASSFRNVPIKGALAYLDGGNAWILTQDSGNRFPLVASADLDSRVFSLSPDGQWLLFSRGEEARLNALFAVAAFGGEQPFPLGVFNVIHFADWSPAQKRTIAFSTVEPATSAPGWKAKNDLRLISFDEKGKTGAETILLPPNTEGAYAWWGTKFAWSPDGSKLAYARPDEVGWIPAGGGVRRSLLAITPFRTLADWVWLPAISWTPDGAFLLTVQHGEPLGSEAPEDSPAFDLVAVPSAGGDPIILAEQTGMFAYPAPGPALSLTYERGYNVAFLQAIRPSESDRSRYRLMVFDRDGSNLRAVFPPESEPGLTAGEAAQAEWSPDGSQIALVYEGNLWIVDLASGEGQPLTGDGQVTKVDWR
ncbi:MAG: G5 domain-containing protein [Anaerolineales bacterium]|nr:G5 domain-containing protein [Anaerolineales bacterium]